MNKLKITEWFFFDSLQSVAVRFVHHRHQITKRLEHRKLTSSNRSSSSPTSCSQATRKKIHSKRVCNPNPSWASWNLRFRQTFACWWSGLIRSRQSGLKLLKLVSTCRTCCSTIMKHAFSGSVSHKWSVKIERKKKKLIKVFQVIWKLKILLILWKRSNDLSFRKNIESHDFHLIQRRQLEKLWKSLNPTVSKTTTSRYKKILDN